MSAFRMNRLNKLLLMPYMNTNRLCFNAVRLSTSKSSTSGKQIIISDHCKPVAPYSAATKANGFIFLSGQLGLDPSTNKLVSDDITDQAQQALMNMKGLIGDAGSDLNKICKATVLLADMNDFAAFNKVYADFMEQANVKELPARTAYAVGKLPLNAKVEIEVIVVE